MFITHHIVIRFYVDLTLAQSVKSNVNLTHSINVKILLAINVICELRYNHYPFIYFFLQTQIEMDEPRSDTYCFILFMFLISCFVLGLKTVISELPPSSTALAASICKKITGRLTSAIAKVCIFI